MGKKKAFLFGIGLLIFPYIIWFVLGKDSHVTIHDNLDHEFVYIKQLLQSGNLFGFDLKGTINGTMEGIPRYFYRSGFNLTFLIFYLLPPFSAYLFHHFVVHLIGYAGMWVLLKRYFIKQNDTLVLGIALCFGFLSYYHIQFGASISAQPLILFAFFNLLYNRQKWFDWLIIVSFPFFSFLPLTLPFYTPILLLLAIIKFRRSKCFSSNFFKGLILLWCVNLMVEYNLIYSMLFGEEVSHRTSWDIIALKGGLPSISEAIEYLISRLTFTQFHSGVLTPIPIIAVIIYSILLKKLDKVITFMLLLILFNIFWFILSDYLVYLFSNKINFLKTFNITRFYLFSPFIWLLLLAVCLNKFKLKSKVTNPFGTYVVLAMVFLSILYYNPEFKNNVKLLFGGKLQDAATFGQFYDDNLFNELKSSLPADTKENKVLCVGIFPNLVQYYGIKTLGSYQNNYPLEYKLKFRKIIEPELDKSEFLKNYFDNWGSRCYAFNQELGVKFDYSKSSQVELNQLYFNWNQLRKMNGQYVISAVRINAQSLNQLTLIKTFERKGSYWKIYLYKLI